ncbi:pilin [Actinokineospora sp. HUAS TT18]|uniref:pilin n=1 Tax=Actinokineospora sp. HUAS TT18 TaxID=3447451 RepID=UPI003F52844A
MRRARSRARRPTRPNPFDPARRCRTRQPPRHHRQARPSARRADTPDPARVARSPTEPIRNWIMGVLAGIATVFLTIGGVRRVVGAGDPGEQEKAKECFKAAGIGYCLAALAPLVVTVLKGIVGA